MDDPPLHLGRPAALPASPEAALLDYPPNPHPGEILAEEFLKPMNLSQTALARALGVPPRRINEIVLGKRRVTAETALRLSRYFETTPQFWLGLQADYDLDVASDELGERLDREVRGHAVAV